MKSTGDKTGFKAIFIDVMGLEMAGQWSDMAA